MNKFKLEKKALCKNIDEGGIINIEEVYFCKRKIQNKIPEIVLEINNLKEVFDHKDKDLPPSKYYNFFIPNELTNKDHNSYYAVLAEILQALILRDAYGYKLVTAVTDLSHTLVHTNSGVDSVMYDKEKNIFVMGEAKFYKDLGQAITSIYSDFKKESFYNKLTNFIRNANSSDEFIFKNNNGEIINELSELETLKQITFIHSGFVLHNSDEVKRICEEECDCLKKREYTKIYNNIEKKEIFKAKNSPEFTLNYVLMFIHLPIVDKQELIKLMIKHAEEKMESNGK